MENIQIDDKRMLGAIRKGIEDYNLIKDGDKIAVGVSGGKDSMTLLYCLAKMRNFIGRDYEIYPVMVNLGYEDLDKEKLQEVKEFCNRLNAPLHIVETQIGEIVFDIRKEKNPCSLCANMRRGAVNKKAKELSCNKVALAHSADDFIETFLMSLFHEGRLSTISPISYLSRMDLEVIRPMLYVDEVDVIKFSKHLPILINPCKIDKHTNRQFVKEYIVKMKEDFENPREMLKTAIFSKEKYNMLDKFAGKVE